MYSPSRLLEVGQVLILWVSDCLPTCHPTREQGKVKSVSQSISICCRPPATYSHKWLLPAQSWRGIFRLREKKKNDIYYYLPTYLPSWYVTSILLAPPRLLKRIPVPLSVRYATAQEVVYTVQLVTGRQTLPMLEAGLCIIALFYDEQSEARIKGNLPRCHLYLRPSHIHSGCVNA